jgi:gas vesicle protein
MSNRENETREKNQSRNKEGNSSKNFIAGAVIGGVVGAAAALLFAPKAGKEIRSDLNNYLEKTALLGDDVAEKSNDLAVAAKEKTASISKAVVQQSKELVNKAMGMSAGNDDQEEEQETNYIPIHGLVNKTGKASGEPEIDIRRKLEEAQKAFDEAESSMKK